MQQPPPNRFVKIRKAHTCTVCRKSFPKGTLMYMHTYRMEKFKSTYTCEECRARIIDNRKENDAYLLTNFEPVKVVISKQFDGTPDEYLEMKRSQRLIRGNND